MDMPVPDMTTASIADAIAPISRQIWDAKYRHKSADGAPVDLTIEDTWRRVARALAAVEAEPGRWEERFYAALQDFRFLPAGRILSGAGTGRRVTLFNCFVMGDIADDLGAIFDHLREAALTMQQGGGIGYDFSSLRPHGAPVRGVGADASGPLSFMDVWDAMCRTIMSAGARRGAMMATMRCDHPDIEAFIAAKREAGRLRNFNLSVLATDPFMAAVEADADWPLVFGGRTYRTLRARALFDSITRATYDYAEPGVIFIDRINARNNLHYCETIRSTNPCVTADTWVHTANGPRQVQDLIGCQFDAMVDGSPHASSSAGFFLTGKKPVFILKTVEGHCLRVTANHKVMTAASKTRYRVGREWVAAGELNAGDQIVLQRQRCPAEWEGAGTAAEGYLMGLLTGDGTVKAEKAVLSVWTPAQAGNGGTFEDGSASVMRLAEDAARTLPHRADFKGWMSVAGRNEHRLSTAAIGKVAADYGLSREKAIGSAIEKASSDFQRAFLRGLFDADGSVQGAQDKGVSVRLSQSNPARLEAVQRILGRMGIISTIYSGRRDAGESRLPDGKGGTVAYATLAQHELVVSGDNLGRYAELVGFGDSRKALRLKASLQAYKRAPNRERFVATVESFEAVGFEDVYDCSIPGINAFDANGFYVHNCGEQPLPPYGACLLGSVNLARLVADPFTPHAGISREDLADLVQVAVRMLDNTIDASGFPLEAQRQEALAKRRIGLGITGLADALVMCGLRYGSPEAAAQAGEWAAQIARAAYLCSAGLAEEKGAFPLYDKQAYLAGETVRELDADVRETIARHGIRNALLTSVAPTGTISLVADNVSSGVEPVFALAYTRKVLQPDGTRMEEEVSDYALRRFRAIHGDEAALPAAFVTAQELTPGEHVRMQAAVQRHVDSAISKTVNVPEDIGFEAFQAVYLDAYRSGCKGCTTYRPNAITGSVLAVKPAETAAAAEPAAAMSDLMVRSDKLVGATYKLRWPDSEHAMYVTVNDIQEAGMRRPFEIFVNSKGMEHYAWVVGLTRMISAVFRRGGEVAFVAEELKQVFDPRGGHWSHGRYVPSLVAAIGDIIERHMVESGFLVPAAALAATPPAQSAATMPTAQLGPLCPKCSQPGLVREAGCLSCLHCGWSKCS